MSASQADEKETHRGPEHPAVGNHQVWTLTGDLFRAHLLLIIKGIGDRGRPIIKQFRAGFGTQWSVGQSASPPIDLHPPSLICNIV